jgi:hypothetical protein
MATWARRGRKVVLASRTEDIKARRALAPIGFIGRNHCVAEEVKIGLGPHLSLGITYLPMHLQSLLVARDGLIEVALILVNDAQVIDRLTLPLCITQLPIDLPSLLGTWLASPIGVREPEGPGLAAVPGRGWVNG